jgi:hypothetical protein
VKLFLSVPVLKKAEEMQEDLGIDGKIKTSPVGSGTGQWSHALMMTFYRSGGIYLTTLYRLQ